jgi:integrase
VEAKLVSKLNPATVGHCIRLLSTFYSDLVERGIAQANVVRALPRSTRRLYRPTADPRATPFLERLDDVRRVFLALPEPIDIAFTIGAFCGLRTGEVLALQWRDIDLEARRIHVHQQVRDGRLAPLKDDESRIVPVQAALAPILATWKLKSGGTGQLFVPAVAKRGGRPGRPATFVRPNTLWRHLRTALATCKLPRLTWYQATRHTFASQWVLAGGSMEKLSAMMGHSSVVVTERYAHLRPDLFGERDLALLDVDLTRTRADVVRVRSPSSRGRATDGPRTQHGYRSRRGLTP